MGKDGTLVVNTSQSETIASTAPLPLPQKW